MLTWWAHSTLTNERTAAAGRVLGPVSQFGRVGDNSLPSAIPAGAAGIAAPAFAAYDGVLATNPCVLRSRRSTSCERPRADSTDVYGCEAAVERGLLGD
jgi:hypothetical protein